MGVFLRPRSGWIAESQVSWTNQSVKSHWAPPLDVLHDKGDPSLWGVGLATGAHLYQGRLVRGRVQLGQILLPRDGQGDILEVLQGDGHLRQDRETPGKGAREREWGRERGRETERVRNDGTEAVFPRGFHVKAKWVMRQTLPSSWWVTHSSPSGHKPSGRILR